MLQGLSQGAWEALYGAAGEAAKFGASAVSPEHLLLSLLRQEGTMTARLLRENGTCADCMFTDLVENLQSGIHHGRWEERGDSMRLLEQFCTDMVAASVHTEPVVGREEEIDTILGILCRKNKNNPALIGEPGSAI